MLFFGLWYRKSILLVLYKYGMLQSNVPGSYFKLLPKTRCSVFFRSTHLKCTAKSKVGYLFTMLQYSICRLAWLKKAYFGYCNKRSMLSWVIEAFYDDLSETITAWSALPGLVYGKLSSYHIKENAMVPPHTAHETKLFI